MYWRTVILTAFLIGSAFAASAETPVPAFAEITVTLVTNAAGDKVFAKIDEIFVLAGSDRTPVDSLGVSCRLDSNPWTLQIKEGLELPVAWTVVSRATSGWLFFGGTGGRAQLALPAGGWPTHCRCEGKNDEPEVILHGAILLTDGSLASSVSISARNSNFAERLVPFFRGRSPKPPTTLRILLSWDELT